MMGWDYSLLYLSNGWHCHPHITTVDLGHTYTVILIAHRQIEVVTTQSVLCVEGNGFREAGELISIELTLISCKYLHIKMRYLSLGAVEGGKDCMFDTISVYS